MIDFVQTSLIDRKRLKFPQSSRYRFSSTSSSSSLTPRWNRSKDWRQPIIFFKLMFALILVGFLLAICFEQSSILNQKDETRANCSMSTNIRWTDYWFAYLIPLNLLSSFFDHCRKQHWISSRSNQTIQTILIVLGVVLLTIGHLQVYSSVFWPSTSSSLSSLTLASMLSIVLIDLFPISIAIFILIKSGDKSGCFRRTMISSV